MKSLFKFALTTALLALMIYGVIGMLWAIARVILLLFMLLFMGK